MCNVTYRDVEWRVPRGSCAACGPFPWVGEEVMSCTRIIVFYEAVFHVIKLLHS